MTSTNVTCLLVFLVGIGWPTVRYLIQRQRVNRYWDRRTDELLRQRLAELSDFQDEEVAS